MILSSIFDIISGCHDLIAKWRRPRKEDPIPLPPRKRALTLPLPPWVPDSESSQTEQRSEDQLQSSFFTVLPPEIRNMIYQYALCNFTHIPVLQQRDLVGHYVCHWTHRPDSELFETLNGLGGNLTHDIPWNPAKWQDRIDTTDLLPLLRTCRRVYVCIHFSVSPGIHIQNRTHQINSDKNSDIPKLSTSSIPATSSASTTSIQSPASSRPPYHDVSTSSKPSSCRLQKLHFNTWLQPTFRM